MVASIVFCGKPSTGRCVIFQVAPCPTYPHINNAVLFGNLSPIDRISPHIGMKMSIENHVYGLIFHQTDQTAKACISKGSRARPGIPIIFFIRGIRPMMQDYKLPFRLTFLQFAFQPFLLRTLHLKVIFQITVKHPKRSLSIIKNDNGPSHRTGDGIDCTNIDHHLHFPEVAMGTLAVKGPRP
jgi:hypothetical protein